MVPTTELASRCDPRDRIDGTLMAVPSTRSSAPVLAVCDSRGLPFTGVAWKRPEPIPCDEWANEDNEPVDRCERVERCRARVVSGRIAVR